MHIATCGATSNMARQGSRNLVGLDRRDDIHINTLMGKDVSRDPAIATVIAKTDQHKDSIGIELKNLVGGKLARQLHKLSLRSSLTLDNILEAKDFLGTHNRFHLCS